MRYKERSELQLIFGYLGIQTTYYGGCHRNNWLEFFGV